ncbi:hypothetical protein HRI_003606500 [Hibiscus trionum]|uniref:Uncharacterized protein n=1 Tax=Hibiscus trionum TaxID=183268 RepID=A0A9W7IMN0_HIBTR|nr:hypothetical protein HRI_003606500 [Hibiscus trionum]
MSRQTSNSWNHFGVRGPDGVLEALPFRTWIFPPGWRRSPADYYPPDGKPIFRVEWRALNLERAERGETLNTMPPEARTRGTAVAYRNRIYVLGGDCFGDPVCPDKKFNNFHFHNCVFYFDYARPDCGWKKGLPMLLPRDSPSAVATQGKIYAFGSGPYGYTGDCFAEVFNVELNRWDKLPAPPVASGLVPGSVSPHVLLDSSRSRILVHFSSNDSLHAFHTHGGSWECLDPEFGDWSEASVIVGDIAYFLFDLDPAYAQTGLASFQAYHVVDKKWLAVKWLSEPQLIDVPFEHMFHLGKGRMCVLLHHYAEGSFWYITFRVKVTSDREVHAEADSESIRTVPSQDPSSRFLVL